MNMKHILATATVAAALGAPLSNAFADDAMGMSATDMAEAHFQAIAAGDIAALKSHYAKDALFQWVGGPLDGAYTGADSIAQVWTKFTKGQGKMHAEVIDISQGANAQGATVVARVKFAGNKTIPVRYVLVYRGERLVDEIWQIDPKLTAY
ncbi:nuclear transport factor 2 family protein [Varunaivibrio sulfuroxidans]|uniref:SnoaL-like protein n=1 Tax=Varunaivibrio sulfuroxidans TaxID=1773489 RepID=A0A4R3JD52_9PROT|nr:nuclear transport factor 2 family protein [Varunaivibrio sulfuroxidans]TCS63614.1 SnoaL-like protein [Varunaivibrio sulfuroxidans]WES30244.1 nuclear transport factor 2 family protein [Varunaivibrio sulfuroxidans]